MLRLNARAVSAALLITTTMCAAWPAAAELETRLVTPFGEVSATGPVAVQIAIGAEHALQVDGASINTKVSGSRLEISATAAGKVIVTLPRLDALALAGGSQAQLADLAGGSTRMKIADASQVTASGAVDTLDVTVTGTGQAQLGELAAGEASVNVRGSGGVVVQARNKLAVLIAGKGTVEHVGKPLQGTDVTITGGGRVTQR